MARLTGHRPFGQVLSPEQVVVQQLAAKIEQLMRQGLDERQLWAEIARMCAQMPNCNDAIATAAYNEAVEVAAERQRQIAERGRTPLLSARNLLIAAGLGVVLLVAFVPRR